MRLNKRFADWRRVPRVACPPVQVHLHSTAGQASSGTHPFIQTHSTSSLLKCSFGFTVLEVVLAIGLCGALIALLATAIDLYLVRIDTNRTSVEAAQLARTLLEEIADDLRAVRYYNPAGDATGGTNDPNSSAGSSSSTLESEATSQVLGIFGSATELRVDRAARWNWQRTAREVDPTEPTTQNEMPLTVAYLFNDGERLLTEQLAAMGVPTESTPGYSGLYRSQTPTPAWIYQSSASGVSLTSVAQVEPELLAPEVLSLQFSYFDGSELLDAWDSSAQEGLPVAIEIRITVLKEPYDLAMNTTRAEREAILQRAENSVEYSLFVKLPYTAPPQSSMLAGSASQSGSSSGQGSGQGGQGSAGQGGGGGGSGS